MRRTGRGVGVAGRTGGRRDLERRVRDQVRELDVGSPLDVPALCQRLGERRGRPLELRAQELPVPGPFGIWVATDETDLVLYQARTTPVHQTLIILHELGHIMAGHPSDRGEPAGGGPPDDELLGALFPHLPPEFVRAALQRQDYDDDHEREAETVGSIILNWAGRIDHVTPPSAATEAGRRLQDGLGEHLGWR